MAEIVFAAGSSHAPSLHSPAEEQLLHGDIDKGASFWPRQMVDKEGNKCSYEELLAKAPVNLEEELLPEVIEHRVAESQASLDRLATAIKDAELDALIIIGDDQKEQYFDDNMPAVLIYWGETIRNNVVDLPEDSPDFWVFARSLCHEEEVARDYPVAADLGLHLLTYLIDNEFDVSHAKELRFERGESHAYGFVHRRLMRDHVIPIVPVAMNTYFPPNRLHPKRCFKLGQSIRRAVEEWPEPGRIGVMASGGLTHFTIDEELDQSILAALRSGDSDALVSIPTNKLDAGSSEIRNWIVMAGAAEHLNVEWLDYIPLYRSLAGTGVGIGVGVMA